MKKILKSLLMITAVSIVAVGATQAFFSDTETSTANTFTAGTLELKVKDNDESFGDGVTGSVVIENMMPCEQSSEYLIGLKNAGSIDAESVLLTITCDEEENGVTEPECTAYGGTWDGTSCLGGTPVNNLCHRIFIRDIIYDDTDITIDINNYVNANCGGVTTAIQPSELANCTVGPNIENYTPEGKLRAGEESNFKMKFIMLCSAGNEYQSDRATINFTFEARQE